MRVDKLEEWGIQVPRTRDEYFDALVLLKERIGDDRAYAWTGAPQAAQVWLNRTHDSYPFWVDYGNELFYVSERTGEVKAWIETEEFATNARFMRKLWENDLIHPDWISLPNNAPYRQYDLLGIGGLPEGSVAPDNYELGVFLNPSAEAFVDVHVSLPVLNTNAVPITTSNPEAGVTFLNWLHASRDNHDLFLFGIEGRHWNRVTDPVHGDRFIEVIRDASGQPPYQFRFWQIGYRPWRRFAPDIHPTALEYQLGEHPTTKFLTPTAFRFNTSPVEAEFQNVLAEWDRSILPIKMGNQSYDEAFPNALRRMNAAGYQAVVNEFRRQYTAWYGAR